MPTSNYLSNSNATTITLNTANNIDVSTAFTYTDNYIRIDSISSNKINPVLYFSYIKSKFKYLEKNKIEKRIKVLEAAFDEVVKNGQKLLGEKILNSIVINTRESIMYAKGVEYYIEYDDVQKYKRNIRGGHISDTLFKDFTRKIPKKVLEKKKKLEDVFDNFVIFHYWNPNAKDIKKMDEEEKSKMKDPVLFGIIKETNRLYFIADWEDEYCDLTFDELVEKIGKEKINKKIKFIGE